MINSLSIIAIGIAISLLNGAVKKNNERVDSLAQEYCDLYVTDFTQINGGTMYTRCLEKFGLK